MEKTRDFKYTVIFTLAFWGILFGACLFAYLKTDTPENKWVRLAGDVINEKDYNYTVMIQTGYLNMNMYEFEGTVEIVKEDYITLKVTDSKNTNINVGDVIEVSKYLIVTDSTFNKDIMFREFKKDSRDIRYRNEEGLKFIGEKEPNVNYEKGSCVKISMPSDIDAENNGRVAALSISNIDN